MLHIRSSHIRMAGVIALFLLVDSCSLKYNSPVLDLATYQWNEWADEKAELTMLPETGHPPSCGWDDLHRGMGNLVRIPSNIEGYKGVKWYHARFTLPSLWDDRNIAFHFEGAGPVTEVYLNSELVGSHSGLDTSFNVDVTESIYYTRDNHLAIRISDPEGSGGITGDIIVVSTTEESTGDLPEAGQ